MIIAKTWTLIKAGICRIIFVRSIGEKHRRERVRNQRIRDIVR
jgi:hypothetical protein